MRLISTFACVIAAGVLAPTFVSAQPSTPPTDPRAPQPGAAESGPATPESAATAGAAPAGATADSPHAGAPADGTSTAAAPGLAPPAQPGAPPTAPLQPLAAEGPGPGALPTACVPACRTGFTCVAGRCVSSCNPPCALGEYCSAHGECVPRPLEPLPGSREHALADLGIETHDGFFLRFTTGFGGGAVTLDVPDRPELTYSGGGWSTSLDIGGAPVRDLVIFGRLRGAWLVDPELREDGERLGDTDGLSVNQGLVGAGINYYVMPLNLYFGGVIGFAGIETLQSRRNRDDVRDRSRVGVGVDLDVGKEWWVSDNWGLGVALRLSLSAVPADDDLPQDSVLGSGFVAVLFSATYQ